MDSSATIAGGIFMLFCIILFVIITRSKRKKEKQFFQPLNRLAEMDNCKISQYDIWNTSTIGIDNLSNHVFFVKNIFNDETSLSIKLSEILKCRLHEVSQTVNLASRTVGIKGNVVKVIDKIELVFINRDKNKADVVAEFYNANTDRLTLTGELQLAEKWCMLINNKITSLSN